MGTFNRVLEWGCEVRGDRGRVRFRSKKKEGVVALDLLIGERV